MPSMKTEQEFIDAIMNAGLTEGELEAALIFVTVLFVAIFAGFIISWVLALIARWRIFTKAGEKGWKGIIPVYSGFIQYRLTWNTKMFWIALALIVVGEFMGEEGVVGFFGLLIATAGYFINNVLAAHKLSKSFGHGVPFTVGLCFFTGIFMLILAFGKSRYVGNTTLAAPAEAPVAAPAAEIPGAEAPAEDKAE